MIICLPCWYRHARMTFDIVWVFRNSTKTLRHNWLLLDSKQAACRWRCGETDSCSACGCIARPRLSLSPPDSLVVCDSARSFFRDWDIPRELHFIPDRDAEAAALPTLSNTVQGRLVNFLHKNGHAPVTNIQIQKKKLLSILAINLYFFNN